MQSGEPRVFTIPPGVPALAGFVDALLTGKLIDDFIFDQDPLALASVTVYVPTRRAAKALVACFVQHLPGPSYILPKIIPLGHVDQLETASLLEETDLSDPALWTQALAVPSLTRRLVLSRMSLAWTRSLTKAIRTIDGQGNKVFDEEESFLVATTLPQAWRLSADLANLIDEMLIEGIEWTRLEKLVPTEFDRYWNVTLDFLKIAMEHWPLYLQSEGLIDKVARESLLIESRIARLQSGLEQSPIFALGSTGTQSTTARLLSAIARAPRGAVILPGLDLEMDDKSWRIIGGDEDEDPAATHPQAALRRLLSTIGIDRANVRSLGEPDAALHYRNMFMTQAMLPAATTESWRDIAAILSQKNIALALQDISLIEANDEGQEALALALSIRQALETEHQTVALITPDRDLARRIRAELLRWNIEIDDSGGEALGKTSIGSLARLLLAATQADASSADLLALLSHRLALFGHTRAEVQKQVHLLDLCVFRQPISCQNELSSRLDQARLMAERHHAHPALKRIKPEEWENLNLYVQKIHECLASLRSKTGARSLSEWIECHVETLKKVLASDDMLRTDDLGALETFSELMQELSLSAHFIGEDLEARDYQTFLDLILEEAIFRGSHRTHPRVRILGLLEARLLEADVLLLGGLDETIWPPQSQTDAFLNRPMRMELGLSSPERRIGQTAHDFVQALGHKKIIISRSAKRDGTPTVPSRFLQRMEAVAGDDLWSLCLQRGVEWLALASALEQAQAQPALTPPQPKPLVDLRPQRLSVTRIEVLRRDPYSIYAERILRLIPLEKLDADLGPRETGTLFHHILAQFAKAYPLGAVPQAAQAHLLNLAEESFNELLNDPAFKIFKWPRITSSLQRFLDWDLERRSGLSDLLVETSGQIEIPLQDGSLFKLTAQPDRIEYYKDGHIAIIDYKTGTPPTQKEVEVGFASQLTLEAAMVTRGAFAITVKNEDIGESLYVQMIAQGELTPVKINATKMQEWTIKHYDGLVQLLNQFRNPDMPYLSRPYVKFTHRYADYDHLARVKEWSAGAEGSEE